MCGETIEIQGHLKEDIKTWCSGNFLKHMKVIWIRSSNNGGLTGHLLLPMKVCSNGTWLHLIEFLTEETNLQITLAVVNVIIYSLQTVWLHCQELHSYNSLNLDKSSWC